MNIYIDEAGPFIPPKGNRRYSLVLALVVPTATQTELFYQFLRLRDSRSPNSSRPSKTRGITGQEFYRSGDAASTSHSKTRAHAVQHFSRAGLCPLPSTCTDRAFMTRPSTLSYDEGVCCASSQVCWRTWRCCLLI